MRFYLSKFQDLTYILMPVRFKKYKSDLNNLMRF